MRPEAGPAVAVTRPGEDEVGEDRLAILLRDEGVRPVHFPLLTLAPARSLAPLRSAVERMAEALVRGGPLPYGWLLVTSRNALPPLLEALARTGADLPALQAAGLRVAAVGQATAAGLRAAAVEPDLVPFRATGEDLLAALHRREGGLSGVEALLPRAEVARDVLPEGIRARGGRVDVVTAYRVVGDPGKARELIRAVEEGAVDGVTLTSGRAARLLGSVRARDGGRSWPSHVAVGVIGPVTARAALEAGIPVHVMPEEASLPGLARAMAEALLGTEREGRREERE